MEERGIAFKVVPTGGAVGQWKRRMRVLGPILVVLAGVTAVVTLVWRDVTTPAVEAGIPAARPARPGFVIFQVEGKQIPLPPGDWRPAARTTGRGDDSGAEPTSLVLFRLRSGQVDAAVLVQTTRPGSAARWGLPAPCRQGDFQPRQVRYASDHDGACAYASYIETQRAPANYVADKAWQGAMRHAVDHGWDVPASWISATYRIVDPLDALQVRYLFHPWRTAEDAMPASPAWRRVYQIRLGVWMEECWPALFAGFRGRLASREEATLWAWDDMEVRLSGRSQNDPEARSDDSRMRAALEVSQRMFSSMTEFGVAWLYLGNAATAATLAVLRTATSGALQVMQSTLSDMVAPAAPAHDLPGIGPEHPMP